MKRILFVDDEQKILDGLRRMLRPQRRQWETTFVSSGQEALATLACAPFDVVVSDMRMPGMDGAQLLNEVRKQYPHIVRIVLSGQSDQETLLRSVRSTHQYLSKPCNPDALIATVTHACALRDLLGQDSLRKLVGGMQSLPSLPALYEELIEELRSPDASIKKAAQIISKDLGMASKILQLVNSSFFGVGGHISDTAQAVTFLGLDLVKSLVLTVQVFSQFRPMRQSIFSLDVLWKHSLATSGLARAIAKAEHASPQLIDDATTAGLLHDLGILVLLANLPQPYADVLAQASNRGVPEWEVERETFGATHAEVGAYVLGLWGLDDTVVEAVAFHHCPARSPGRALSPLTAVHVANALVQEDRVSDIGGAPVSIDADYLAALDLTDRLTEWRAISRATSRTET